MTAQEHLASYGVTMEVAKEFIMSSLENLQNIFDVCKQFGVTNDMIAEIVGIEGINGTGVANFFAQNGIDSNALGGSIRNIEIVDLTQIDTTAPQINVINVYPDEIIITFNESITFTGEGYTFGIWYADGSSYGNSTLTIDDNNLIIFPEAGMVDGTKYMIYGKSNVIEDLSGNNFEGIPAGDAVFIA